MNGPGEDTGQATLDDYRRGISGQLRTTGQRRAAQADPDGFDLAMDAITRLAADGYSFTGDDVRRLVPGCGAVMGSAFRFASSHGLISFVGYTTSQATSRRGWVLRLWKGSGAA